MDGTELIGDLVTTASMEFEEYDGDEGDFEIRTINFDGSSSISSGEYAINADGDELEFDYDDGTREEWDFTLEDDDLELETNIDGIRYVIEAERD